MLVEARPRSTTTSTTSRSSRSIRTAPSRSGGGSGSSPRASGASRSAARSSRSTTGRARRDPERPLLNHVGVLVESVEEHIAEAEELGVEVDDVVDAPNTIALFVWGPEHVKLEYIEHKPTFSLT